jgi:hypothetical protein
VILKIKPKKKSNNINSDLYYVVLHKDSYSHKNAPLPSKIVEYTFRAEIPDVGGIDCYRYLLGKDISYSNRHEQTIFKNLTAQDITFLALKLDIVEVYTAQFNSIVSREFELSCGKFVDALKVLDGLASSQRKAAIKKDPIYEVVYLTDVQKELYRAKGYMSKSIIDDEYTKLIDSAILSPKQLKDKKLSDWYFKILDSMYKLRYK